MADSASPAPASSPTLASTSAQSPPITSPSPPRVKPKGSVLWRKKASQVILLNNIVTTWKREVNKVGKLFLVGHNSPHSNISEHRCRKLSQKHGLTTQNILDFQKLFNNLNTEKTRPLTSEEFAKACRVHFEEELESKSDPKGYERRMSELIEDSTSTQMSITFEMFMDDLFKNLDLKSIEKDERSLSLMESRQSIAKSLVSSKSQESDEAQDKVLLEGNKSQAWNDAADKMAKHTTLLHHLILYVVSESKGYSSIAKWYKKNKRRLPHVIEAYAKAAVTVHLDDKEVKRHAEELQIYNKLVINQLKKKSNSPIRPFTPDVRPRGLTAYTDMQNLNSLLRQDTMRHGRRYGSRNTASKIESESGSYFMGVTAPEKNTLIGYKKKSQEQNIKKITHGHDLHKMGLRTSGHANPRMQRAPGKIYVEDRVGFVPSHRRSEMVDPLVIIAEWMYNNFSTKKRVFHEVDKDQSGFATAEEFGQFIHKQKEYGLLLSDNQLEELVKKFDLNGDGAVSLTEFCQTVDNAVRKFHRSRNIAKHSSKLPSQFPTLKKFQVGSISRKLRNKSKGIGGELNFDHVKEIRRSSPAIRRRLSSSNAYPATFMLIAGEKVSPSKRPFTAPANSM